MGHTMMMEFRDITPHVRYVNLMQCPSLFIEGPRKIYDHQLVYVHKGQGFIDIDGISYTALPGDLFFYGPSVTHTFVADKENPYLLSGIHFDFTRGNREKLFPIGPFSAAQFKEELALESVDFLDFTGIPPYLNLSEDIRVKEIILEMVDEYTHGRIYAEAYINGLFVKLLSIIGRHITVRHQGIAIKESVINQVIKFIHDNYNANLTNEIIGERFHFHPNYLNQLMVAHTGVPLRQYLIDLRIKKAMELILNTNMSISEISEGVGYEDMHYFSRLFKKKTGFAPSQIKR